MGQHTAPPPRLLYLADVRVEATHSGAMQLFRLLEYYPPNQLLIVESNLEPETPSRRLNQVNYLEIPLVNRKIMHSRLHKYYASWISAVSSNHIRKIPKIIGAFRPEAVLTVMHSYSWLTAARLAAHLKIPLHVICHDDWPRMTSVMDCLKPFIDSQFGATYRLAASRLCVSPFMRQDYMRRYGVDSELLYPCRGATDPEFSTPPTRLEKAAQGLTIAFAGSITSNDFFQLFSELARILEPLGGKLLLFGSLTTEQARRNGLLNTNIHIRGFIERSEDLINILRKEADVLFVPMSFEARHRANMEINFPSKLTDYTAAGVPLLIQGPDYCSAIRWANDNPGVAAVLTTPHTDDLLEVVRRLSADADWRKSLSTNAINAGKCHFSYNHAQELFLNALTCAAHNDI